jgi:Glycosyl hydrolase family 3 N terminal domain
MVTCSLRSKRRLALVLLSMVAASAASAVPAAAKDRWIDNKIQRMTLEEKVGQLFVANVYGESVDTANPADVAANQTMYGPGVSNAEDLIERYKLGGIIYFRWTNNVNEPRQIAHLSNGIQRVALDQPARIPMLISTDQEQGVVSRVWAPATEFPGNMALGATRRPADAFASANVTAKELRALGINQNFAPVADVNINPLNPELCPGRRRQHQPAEPGHRGSLLRREPGPRLPDVSGSSRRDAAGRRLGDLEALPRPRRHSHGQPHRGALDLPHQGTVGGDRRPTLPGRDRRGRRHGHDRARDHARAAERLRRRDPGWL